MIAQLIPDTNLMLASDVDKQVIWNTRDRTETEALWVEVP